MKSSRGSIIFFFTSLIFLTFLTSALQCKNDITGTDNQNLTAVAEISQMRVPLFTGKSNEKIVTLKFNIPEIKGNVILKDVSVVFSETSNLAGITSVNAVYSGNGHSSVYGTSAPVSGKVTFKGNLELFGNTHYLSFDFTLKSGADLLTRFGIREIELSFNNNKTIKVPSRDDYIHRSALLLRAAGQDNCNTYRIPGLTTTNKGTLIAVYDNRYNSSKDLQEDIDIGMSRSTDGGQTWEPMKVIMDMGEFGGRSERLNGTGDPCVLYDEKTGTLWVAALWMSGSSYDQALWWASKPGMKPEETGQFLLVKSTDDGLTWSQPINITSQIKVPSWQLLLQGPGRGLTTRNGTLVFPAQFKADIGTKAIDGGQYTCHSTIVYSKDGGHTWQIGTGAKSNTTEAQVVELADGSLMLNMRDDRNRSDKGETNGRAVAVTNDWGKTWKVHPSSNAALPEPNCMGSMIAADVPVGGKIQQVLFFSNPNSKTERIHMTLKASVDGGLSWPETFWTELDSGSGNGYSCLTMIDNSTIGILYEGTKELYFQKIPVSDILSTVMK
jgi:sialidase-1